MRAHIDCTGEASLFTNTVPAPKKSNEWGGALSHSNLANLQIRLGKASCMPGGLWPAWLKHLLAVGPTWLYVASILCHTLCLRITEALRLVKSDFDWQRRRVRVRGMKRQPEVHKHILKSVLPKLRQLRHKGVKRQRERNKGVLGIQKEWDSWAWPEREDELLFPSERADCGTPHRNKDTACKAVARARQSFKPPAGHYVLSSRIRTHSARHRMVNDMKFAHVGDDTAMRFARIYDKRIDEGHTTP